MQQWGIGVSIFPPVCTGTQNPQNFFSNTYVLPSVNRTAGPTKRKLYLWYHRNEDAMCHRWVREVRLWSLVGQNMQDFCSKLYQSEHKSWDEYLRIYAHDIVQCTPQTSDTPLPSLGEVTVCISPMSIVHACIGKAEIGNGRGVPSKMRCKGSTDDSLTLGISDQIKKGKWLIWSEK